MRSLIAFLALAIAAPAHELRAQEVGDWVVVTAKQSAEIKKGSETIAAIPRGEILRVQQVEREWRRVTWNSTKGWLRKADVIPLERAENYFTSVISRDPSAAEYAFRGNARLKLGRLDGAIADFDQSLNMKPEQPPILTLRGSAQQAKGEIDKAIADYSRAIELDGEYSHAWNNRGNSYLAKNDYEQAIADFDRAIELQPQAAIYYTNRGTAWEAAGDMDKAIADHSKAIEIDPECDAALLNRARVRHRQGNYREALSNFEAALGLDLQDPRPYNGIAWLHATCPDEAFRDGKKAVEYAQQACELSGNQNANYLDTLAAAYARNGQFDMAVETIRQAIELDPADEYNERLELYQQGKAYSE